MYKKAYAEKTDKWGREFKIHLWDDEEGYDAVRSAAIRRMGEALAVVEANVEGPFLIGEDMCLADIYLAMFYIWHRGEIEAPRLSAVAQAVRTHSTVGPIWRRHFGDR